MRYSNAEVMEYVREEDVKFIRIAFCDVFGRQKNISIMPQELPRAFEYGIAFDASAIAGFDGDTRSDLLLHPDAETLTASLSRDGFRTLTIQVSGSELVKELDHIPNGVIISVR